MTCHKTGPRMKHSGKLTFVLSFIMTDDCCSWQIVTNVTLKGCHLVSAWLRPWVLMKVILGWSYEDRYQDIIRTEDRDWPDTINGKTKLMVVVDQDRIIPYLFNFCPFTTETTKLHTSCCFMCKIKGLKYI